MAIRDIPPGPFIVFFFFAIVLGLVWLVDAVFWHPGHYTCAYEVLDSSGTPVQERSVLDLRGRTRYTAKSQADCQRWVDEAEKLR